MDRRDLALSQKPHSHDFQPSCDLLQVHAPQLDCLSNKSCCFMRINNTYNLLLTLNPPPPTPPPIHTLLSTLPITHNPQQSTVSPSHSTSPLTSVIKSNSHTERALTAGEYCFMQQHFVPHKWTPHLKLKPCEDEYEGHCDKIN